MIIKINRETTIDVNESFLIVKDNKLYNTKTKKYEGVEGDIITFYIETSNGGKSWARGYVEGYTCGNNIKLRGIDTPYVAATISLVEHISSVTACEDTVNAEEELKLAMA
jgi:hypothetical protein